MAKSSVVYARIDTDLKENAENILHQLGISPSSAIQMLYSQVVLTKSFPLNLRLTYKKPVSIGNMTRADLDAELSKGFTSANSSETYTTDDVDKLMKEEFGI